MNKLYIGLITCIFVLGSTSPGLAMSCKDIGTKRASIPLKVKAVDSRNWIKKISIGQRKDSVFVYQAFSNEIADNALSAGKLVAPFNTNLRTWIKPSLEWMLYRSNFAQRPGQERILRIELSRDYFLNLLSQAELTYFDPNTNRHPSYGKWRNAFQQSAVQVQWDPARNLYSHKVGSGERSIQIGIFGKEALTTYSQQAIRSLEDITGIVQHFRRSGKLGPLARLIELEKAFGPLSKQINERIELTSE